MARAALDVPLLLYVDSAGPGGTAVYALNVALPLRALGFRVAVMCSNAELLATMRNQLAQHGVEVHALPYEQQTMRGRLRRWVWFASTLRRYKRGALLLLLGNYTSGTPVIITAALAGMRAIIRADLQPPEPPFPSPFRRAALGIIDRLVDAIVVAAHENCDAFVRYTGRHASRMTVIHTGIDLSLYRPGEGRSEVRTEFGFKPEQKVVGVIARLEEERKGVAQFLQMAASVARSWPDAVFVIVGAGPLRPSLEVQAGALGLRDRVLFPGWRWDITRVLAAMDIFVMPSLYEGGPTIVTEAMAMARPVIASRVGMVPEIVVTGETGLVVEPGDADGLARAVLQLLSDNVLRERIGRAARQYAVRHFSREKMVEGYLSVLASALSAS